MQPRSHEITKRTIRFLFRVFVSSWLPLLWIVAGLAQDKANDGHVGAQACASCHKQVHETWTAGRHSKMIQPATAAAVKGDFSRSGATLQGRRYGFRAENGQYFITESELTGKPQEHRVEFTL